MKKLTYLLFIAAVASGCSVDALDSSEDLQSAGAKAKKGQDQEISTTVYEGPGNAEYVQNSGKLRGHIYVSNDCDNLYVEIVPTEGLPDDVHLGFFQGVSFPKENGTESDLVAYSGQVSFTFPLNDFDTSQDLRIFSKAWGAFAGTESWGKASYFTYTFEEVECEEVCTYGKGWWRNHSTDSPGNQENLWPVDMTLKLGDKEDYTQDQWNVIFDSNNEDSDYKNSNGLVNFAQHLMAAKLNVANGVDDSEIASVILEADALIADEILPVGAFTAEEKKTSDDLKDALEAFNESNPCEDDEEDDSAEE